MQRQCGEWKALLGLRALWNTVGGTMGFWILCSKLGEHLGGAEGDCKALQGLRALREGLGNVKCLMSLMITMGGWGALCELVGMVEG